MVKPFQNYKDFQLVGSESVTFFIQASQDFQLKVDRLLNPNTLFPLPSMNLEMTEGY